MRHPRIRRCSRETDGAGAYNSLFVALFTLQLGSGGTTGRIRVVEHGHNEPGHGSDICDTAGANCIRECWRFTKRFGLSIISAEKTCSALRKASMDGFIHLQVSHDPDCKIIMPKSVKFKGVMIKSCLQKSYPDTGPFAGGIVFNRYFGMGNGIGFTKDQCEAMWNGITLEDHIMKVHSKDVDMGNIGAVVDTSHTHTPQHQRTRLPSTPTHTRPLLAR